MSEPTNVDTCPTCGAHSVQTCVNEDGTPRAADHPARPTALPDGLAVTARAHGGLVMHLVEERPTPPPHPCTLGQHRWAWLVTGGQACGYCGRPR